MPVALQCQTSTSAPASGVHAEPCTCETAKLSANATPGWTEPSPGSEVMSERWSISSTKYGPSVSAGRTTHDGMAAEPDATAAAVAVAAEPAEADGLTLAPT